ncbi:MAG: nicotinamide riboside transporter PnuC [Nitrospirae bacterium]|nr:MAG: nicotinamide riboside transporter PnuC [Nitrospirota bacterium]
MKIVHKWVWTILAFVSIILLTASIKKWTPITPTEVFGFITGAVCVLFVVEQNIWNFPVGIANNIFFIVLFLSARLYGDMMLQVVYIVLGLIGWWQWLYGGVSLTELHVNHASAREILILFSIGAVATAGMREYFIQINDSAPFLDALTTALSLIAQYLLNCKRIENWFVWIVADLIYVGLYVQKGLYLTAVLYVLFIGLCVAGYISWRKSEFQIKKVILV